MGTKATRRAAGWLPPLLADLVCVLVFAAAGKSSHEASTSEWVVLAIVWPYAVSVVLSHVVLLTQGRRTPRVWPEGVVVLCVTYGLGMVLRVVSGRGIAAGFLVVAFLFLTLTLLGWRTLAWLVTRRRSSRAS